MQQKVRYAVPTVHLPFLYLCWRKGLDIAFVVFSLLIMLVLLPLLAFILYIDSPGPIFYKQERVGYRGKKFWMYKFRSMMVDAEQAGNAVWASESDPRVTRVGRFLRSTHLDELPQIVNIFLGDMCLIGPRPEREEYVLELEKASAIYRNRLLVKPGLTGWSQVNYGYGSTSKDELTKVQYDLYYIEHQSFKLDIVILLKTIGEVVLCHGI
jgi:lipopolysaccharide/colanic/teichoic acid biosynthesis glycosyltransferase